MKTWAIKVEHEKSCADKDRTWNIASNKHLRLDSTDDVRAICEIACFRSPELYPNPRWCCPHAEGAIDGDGAHGIYRRL